MVNTQRLEPTEWYQRGIVFDNQGQSQNAIACYSKAIELQADYYEAWVRQGLVLMLLQELTGAIASFNRALALSRELDLAWYLKAYCHMATGAEELGRLALRKALDLSPQQWSSMACQEPLFEPLMNCPDFPELKGT